MCEASLEQPIALNCIALKTCSKCHVAQEAGEFYETTKGSGEYRARCKMCVAELQHTKYETNKDAILSQHKEYASNHRDENKAYGKRYREENKVAISLRVKKWDNDNRDRRRARENERHRTDPNYRFAKLLRTRQRMLLLGRKVSGSAVRDMGCPLEDGRAYFESLFWPGMTWKNDGPMKWEVDHIAPLSSFDLTKRDQYLIATHYTNLQPLWKDDNRCKWGRVDWTPLESKHELPERLK
jgi:hypothetical protein